MERANIETRESRPSFYRKETFRIARWGALGYGVSFGIYGVVSVALRPQIRDFYLNLALGFILYAFCSGLGAASLGKACKSADIYRLAGAGAIGCSFAHVVTVIPSNILSNFLAGMSLWGAYRVAETVRFALVGAFTGLSLGVVQKDWKQARMLAVAGAIGFAVYGLSSLLLFHITLMISNFVYGSIDPVVQGSIASAILEFAHGITFGGIIGALLGLTMEWCELHNT
jgi:hypothetical protein